MSTAESRAQINEQVLEEACGWFIDCNEGALDAAGREHFDQWLRRSPEHARAYLEIAGAWDESYRLKGAEPQLPRAKRRSWLGVSAVAAALLACAIGFVIRSNSYSTGIGEQRSIVLADGSTVELNTRSKLRVRFSQAARTVELVYGEALFQAKQDAARPFIVLSSGTQVRAVGTQFDVYQKTAGTAVTVIEGRVAVTGAGAPVFLAAGERLVVRPGAALRPAPVDAAEATAWTQRRLVFDETPLAEAIAEFNRYNSRQMIIEDASLANYHIRGKFAADDPGRLLQFLRDRFDADVREQGNEILISRR